MNASLIGRTLARYRIVERLGEGGMGVVYRAWDERLERDVALKVLSSRMPELRDASERLREEARVLSRLDHPGIATVLDFDTHDGVEFLVMEFVRGQTLAERIARGPLDEAEVLELAPQLCDALEAAHEQGIVHRDLKAANVMVTVRGRVKVLDFGLALLRRDTELAASSAATRAFGLAGTVAYMAPEQLFGQEVDARSDLFALGVLLHEMLTGVPPFTGPVSTAVADAILHRPADPPSRRRPGVSEGMDAVVLRCLEKRPLDRYPSARALGEDLRRLAAGASLAAPARRRSRTLAVLPFREAAPGTSGFADALGEALVAWFASCDSPRVVSRTSVLRYRGSDRPLPEIARELGVDAVLEGSTWEVAGRVRVTATLLSATGNEHLWAERFERDGGDVLALQDELVNAIGRAVREKLDPEAGHAGPAAEPDPVARAAYLRGRRQWNKRTREGLELAIRHFEEAIDRDPTHAPSFSGLADCYNILAPWLPPGLGYQKAKAAARRALELNPALAEAHTSLAFTQMFADWDWAASEAGFRRAIALDPGYATGHQWYGEYLTVMGRFDEAVIEARAAEELDPLSYAMPTTLVNVFYYARRYDEALEYDRRMAALTSQPAALGGLADRARILEQCGRATEAVTEYLRVLELDDDPRIQTGLACAYALAGRPDDALAVLARLEAMSGARHVPPYAVAGALALLGQLDAAFAKLEQAIATRDRGMVWLRVNPRFDPLRKDPRYDSLVQRMNFPA
jgi:TolB-like protein/predicted Ser/Thr protein kinase